ncbi:hypothetical protein DH2020_017052 [Rehmannia glutinosa]|uniref:RNase H type-1 domain-containing protein n=1 Tax=Rehmannia glutinosa TaxID=99300 RepID=A0ABR0WPZ9_REHGL
MENVDEDSHNIFACLLWIVWYARNTKTYQNKELEHQWCFNFAIRRLEEHRTSIEGIPDTKQPPRSATWRKPEIEWIKINTDASILQGSRTGIGVALRDHDGKIVSTLTRFFTAEMEVNVAEAIACKKGLTYAKTLGLRKIELETDNVTVYKKIKESAPDLSYMGTVIGDIKDLFLYFDSVYISCVRRTGNGVAHLLAQYAFSFSDLDPIIGVMPEHICNVANLEASY